HDALPILICAPHPVPPVFPMKVAIMPGKDMMEEAKIIGITPAVFTFSGIWELCPPTILLPTIFLEYWTGIFLCAPFRISTRTITARMIARMMTAARQLLARLPDTLGFTKDS